MFRKSLKYDLKHIATIWCIMAATVLGLSVVAGNCLDVVVRRADDSSYEGLEVLGVIAFMFALVAFVIVSAILVYLRFYKNFYTDEAYLTFTLPVKRSTLLASKVTNAFIWHTGTVLVCFAALAVMLAYTPGGRMENFAGVEVRYRSMLEYIIDIWGDMFKDIYREAGAWLFLYIAEIIVFFILATLTSILFYYLCITVAAIVAKKHKTFVIIALIYGSSVVTNFIYRILGTALGKWNEAVNIAYTIPEEGLASFALVGAIGALACVVCALVCTAFWCLNVGCIERKLNLA